MLRNALRSYILHMYITGFSVKWCKVVQSGVNTRLVVIFTYGRTPGWSQKPLPVGQRLKTLYLSIPEDTGIILQDFYFYYLGGSMKKKVWLDFPLK